MLSLGCERLPTPLKKKKKKKKKKKVLDHYLHHDLGMLPLLRCVFAHFLILQYPDHHQNLISSSLYYSGPVHKISSQSVHNFLSSVVHRQTNKQTDKLTIATKNITSFAKEVINTKCSHIMQRHAMMGYIIYDRECHCAERATAFFMHVSWWVGRGGGVCQDFQL